MDEDISAINTNTRNEKIKIFFINKKKKIIILFSILILLVFGYFGYEENRGRNIKKISDKYNMARLDYVSGKNFDVENLKEYTDLI